MVLIFLLSPIVVIIGASFNPGSLVIFPPTGFSLKWYPQILMHHDLIYGMEISFIIALVVIPISLLLGLFFGYFVVKTNRKYEVILSTYSLSPVYIPQIVFGIAALQFVYLVFSSSGFLQLLIAHIIITVPFAIQILVSGLRQIDPQLEEAAFNLGESRLGVFRRVILPLLKPSIIAAITYIFILSFDNVAVSLFLSTPLLQPFPVVFYESIIQSLINPTLAAFSTLLVILGAVILTLILKTVGLKSLAGMERTT